MKSFYCLLLLCSAALAGEPEVSPRALYQSGTTHYNLAEYGAALADFKQAYRLRPDPALLFNIAQCHRQLGEFGNAATFYRAYRREVPDAPNRPEVDRLILEMERSAAAEQPARPPSEAAASPANSEPLPAPDSAARPPNATTPAPALSLTTPSPPPKAPLVRRPWFWITIGGSVALLATGITLGAIYGTPAHAPAITIGRVEGN